MQYHYIPFSRDFQLVHGSFLYPRQQFWLASVFQQNCFFRFPRRKDNRGDGQQTLEMNLNEWHSVLLSQLNVLAREPNIRIHLIVISLKQSLTV